MKKIATLLVALMVASMVFAAARLVYRADLAGDGIGKAVYKFTTDNTRKPELQVEAEDMVPNTDLVVKTAGLLIPVTTDDFGAFNVDLKFPISKSLRIADGTPVRVFYMDGTVALRGKFALR